MGNTGGEATHTLTVNEIPSHNHQSPLLGYSDDSTVQGNAPWANKDDDGRSAEDYFTKATGGGQPHNNMPPYIVAYCWRRIS